ncbi:uncharacterized protein PHALS_13218 [Plasmopara halstedii]|uniref:Uncharacterized protein n=1 Tax=Plasmopara halstedii TaxID=4781 RepID=A0A0P1AQ70_PLAHL|nr:uncharacterized protein PHALS_13218 [Plasmopara halstedii]CEG42989.1 hypothetical protein PHALS_13218 [Plasmopara halstedii]|eukprot:XP_024579358.1 hypothetical protein PHALS_13218 [Plasmopara halstedii]
MTQNRGFFQLTFNIDLKIPSTLRGYELSAIVTNNNKIFTDENFYVWSISCVSRSPRIAQPS